LSKPVALVGNSGEANGRAVRAGLVRTFGTQALRSFNSGGCQEVKKTLKNKAHLTGQKWT